MGSSCHSFVLMMVVLLVPSGQAGTLAEKDSSQNNTLTLALLAPFSVHLTLGNRVAAAILPAIEAIQQRGLLPGYDIQWSVGDSGCVSNIGR